MKLGKIGKLPEPRYLWNHLDKGAHTLIGPTINLPDHGYGDLIRYLEFYLILYRKFLGTHVAAGKG